MQTIPHKILELFRRLPEKTPLRVTLNRGTDQKWKIETAFFESCEDREDPVSLDLVLKKQHK